MNSGTAVLPKIAVNSGTIIKTKTIIAGSIRTGAVMNNIPTGLVGEVRWWLWR